MVNNAEIAQCESERDWCLESRRWRYPPLPSRRLGQVAAWTNIPSELNKFQDIMKNEHLRKDDTRLLYI